jgi:methionyl-tRNA formyltransferase
MILSAETAIDPDENAGQLHDKLMVLGSQTVIDTLKLIETEQVNPIIQEDRSEIKTAYKLDKDNCKIDWRKSSAEIHNQIRGLSPYPVAWCYFNDNNQEWNVKIYESKISFEEHALPIGTVLSTKKEIKIAVSNGFIEILSLQFPGKKKMTTSELLNGMTFSDKALVL